MDYYCNRGYTCEEYQASLKVTERNYPSVYRTFFAHCDSIEGIKDVQENYPAIYKHFLFELMETKRDSVCKEVTKRSQAYVIG